MAILVHVDDLVILSPELREACLAKEEQKSVIKLTDLREQKSYLGVSFKQMRKKMFLSQ